VSLSFYDEIIINGSGLKLDNAQYVQGKNAGGTYQNLIGLDASSNLSLYGGKAIIDSSGRLGVGITSSLAGILHLKGGAPQLVIEGTSTDAEINFRNSVVTDTYIDAASATLVFYIHNGSTPTVTMKDGLVGIGVSPAKALDVSSSDAIPIKMNSTNANGGYFDVYSSGTEIVNFGAAKAIGFGGTSAATDGGFFGINNLWIGTGASLFITVNTSQKAIMNSSGNWRWLNYGAGTLVTDASGNITASSDARLKDIQGPFQRGLEALCRVTPIRYRYNARSGLETAGVYVGFAAQDVLTAVPEAVGQDADGYYTLQDRPLIAALVNAVQELSARLTALEAA
jgi:hypothetical protein